MNSNKLTNKCAIITGGGSGIGQAISNQFALEGAHVNILDINPENAISTAEKIITQGGQANAFQCDISDHDNVKEIVAKIQAENERIDILVNNAGIAHIGNVENTTPDDMDRIYNVNVKGVYNCLNTVTPIMVKQGGGAIVNLASVASKLGISERFAYSMSKGAVYTMQKIISTRTYDATAFALEEYILHSWINTSKNITQTIETKCLKNSPNGNLSEEWVNLRK